MKNVTVFGATGMVGRAVTNQLVKAGLKVTALVRDVEKAKQMFSSGVTFVKGDLDNKTSIKEAMKDAEGIFISLSTIDKHKENEFSPEKEGLDNIIEVAKELKIKQIAYLSSFLARNYNGDWWVMVAKKTGITRVKNSGIAYTIFYPSNFMENFKTGMLQGKNISTMGKSANKSWWISAEDFGIQVANALNNEKSLNKEYACQGLEPYTMAEAAKLYVENYEKEKLGLMNLPMGMAKFMSIFMAPLKFGVKLVVVMNNNVETFEAENTWNELGKPKITLAQYAKRG